MNRLCVQIFLGKQWHDAAEISFDKPEAGHQGATKLDYLAPFVIDHMHAPNSAGAVLSCRYPVDFTSHTEAQWPAFLLDLLPGGEGRRRWAKRLNISTGLSGEFELLKHASANPVGNLRIKEAAAYQSKISSTLPDSGGELQPINEHPGFSKAEIINKQEGFIEYAYQRGAAVSGATDVQGEAPKFLLVRDTQDRWHAEGAISDSKIRDHWIVKFPRGKKPADTKVLKNEAPYLEVARQFQLKVAKPLELHEQALFIPRFDRLQKDGRTVRLAVESLYSVAGIAHFGQAASHEQLCQALMAHTAPDKHYATALEYIKRDILNTVMGNTDNHGRNTAILRNRTGDCELSPLFDFAPMYLDPEGIARVTRWDKDKEHAGRPNWKAVVNFFEPWANTQQLERDLNPLTEALQQLDKTMHALGIDQDIITRCSKASQTALQTLR
ncbi:type II toxin-antitoxin system HipA family toxin [Agaribacterium haliotis]|uniref:type II toxin-antitoxin system HipA family toxin n=1 Tax=Agaribacterium haliotis TaxID=2013869 RepID=UPI000BB54B19|nr:HipA domain-containing protein [Agaribacterium haliotis]